MLSGLEDRAIEAVQRHSGITCLRKFTGIGHGLKHLFTRISGEYALIKSGEYALIKDFCYKIKRKVEAGFAGVRG
jgi:hypothetical protein